MSEQERTYRIRKPVWVKEDGEYEEYAMYGTGSLWGVYREPDRLRWHWYSNNNADYRCGPKGFETKEGAMQACEEAFMAHTSRFLERVT